MPIFNNLESLDAVRTKINNSILLAEQHTTDIADLAAEIVILETDLITGVAAAEAAADDAAASAVAALASENAALGYRDTTLTYRDAAAASATLASGQATIATTKASEAAVSAVESEDSAIASAASAAAAAASSTAFPTRASFVTWTATNTPTVGTVITANGLRYEYTGSGTTISDLAGWLPHGTTHVEHFKAIGNGSTDDTVPIQAAIDYVGGMSGGEVLFDAKTYVIGTAGITISTDNTYLVGHGRPPFANAATITGGRTTYRATRMTRLVAKLVAWPALASVIKFATPIGRAYWLLGGGMRGIFVDGNERADFGITVLGMSGARFDAVGCGWTMRDGFSLGVQSGFSDQALTRNVYLDCFYIGTDRGLGSPDFYAGFVFWGDGRTLVDDGLQVVSNFNLSDFIGCWAITASGYGFAFEDCDAIFCLGITGSLIFQSSDTCIRSIQSSNTTKRNVARHIDILGFQGSITARRATTVDGKCAVATSIRVANGNSVNETIEGYTYAEIVATPAFDTYRVPFIEIHRTGANGALTQNGSVTFGGWKAGAIVRLTADQAIPNNTNTKISWNIGLYQKGFTWWTAGDPTRFYVPAGVKQVYCVAGVTYAPGAVVGLRELHIGKNLNPAGTTSGGYGFAKSQTVATGGGVNLNVTHGIVDVVEGDYFEVRVFHTDGAALNVNNNVSTWFGIWAI